MLLISNIFPKTSLADSNMSAPGGKYNVKWSRDPVYMEVPGYLKLDLVNIKWSHQDWVA